MPRSTFRPDRSGIRAHLKSHAVQAEMHQLAEKIASNVRGQHPDLDVVVDDYTTDRAASSVTIRDIRGKIYQARDGLLTKAAAAAGLEVTEHAE